MALLNQSVQVYGKLGQLFETLQEGQAPDKFTREFIRDLGFKSSNWHAAIALLKGLGFLSPDGSPTSQYMEFLDKTKWTKILARAVKEAYSDAFVMKRDPEPSDIPMIAGKYKSTYNMSDTAADRAARTFMALVVLSDRDELLGEDVTVSDAAQEETEQDKDSHQDTATGETTDKIYRTPGTVDLNYNIQIHLPATKDVEVYNAIFKALREHIID